MKAFIIMIIAIAPILRADKDELYNWDTLSQDLRTAFSYKGNICISMGRNIGYSWRLHWNRLFDTDYALGTYDAEYFFYHEQKIRDRTYERLKNLKRGHSLENSCCTSINMKAAKKFHTALDYRKDEIYCREPEDTTKLKRYCRWALYNRKLHKEGWALNEKLIPECEFRRIFLPRYGFESKRTVLKCGYETRIKDEPTRQITAFISAVESSRPVHRLILYLFRSVNASDPFKPPEPSEPPKREHVSSFADPSDAQPIHTQVPKLPKHSSAKQVSSSRDRSKDEPVQTRKKKKRLTKQEYALSPLYLLTLLINRRYIFDYIKQKLPDEE